MTLPQSRWLGTFWLALGSFLSLLCELLHRANRRAVLDRERLRPATIGADDARRDGDRGREVGLAVAADEQHLRVEGLALVGLEAVHQQPLALLDAVLLAADLDDCVGHQSVENAGAPGPRGRKSS